MTPKDIDNKGINMKSAILCVIIYAISSSSSVFAGIEQEHIPKPVNSLIRQDRTARELARVTGGNGAAERKAYSEIRAGEKVKSPSMTYALALFYLLV